MVVCTVKYETVSACKAMEIGDRVLVFRRRARIACAARLDAPLSAAECGKIQDDVMRVLAAEPPAA
jgi:hypothetical protein